MFWLKYMHIEPVYVCCIDGGAGVVAVVLLSSEGLVEQYVCSCICW